MAKDNIHLLSGGMGIDDRGSVSFVNDFNFQNVKRFYVVENFSPNTVRAWHGHKHEAKFVYVPHGSAIVAMVEIDDWENPSRSTPVQRFVLSAKQPKVLYIPAGYANGFRVLEYGTKIIFFSTASLDESQGDDIRWPHDYWGREVWLVEHR